MSNTSDFLKIKRIKSLSSYKLLDRYSSYELVGYIITKISSANSYYQVMFAIFDKNKIISISESKTDIYNTFNALK